MHTCHLRNQLHLYGAKIVTLAFLLGAWFLPTQALAQKTSAKSRTINMPDYDSRWLHYGFQIGIYQSGMPAIYGLGLRDTLSVQRRPGFSLGFITNFRLKDDLWALRVLPNVSFYERIIDFKSKSGNAETQSYEATVVEVPVLLKYKSRRRKNHRMYMLAGVTGALEVGGKASTDIEGITYRKKNLELSYGAGFDLYWTFFKFSPEIRFSHGLVNILGDSNNYYSRQLQRLTTHKVTLYLNFE
jgi:hypothetical protein